MQYNKEFLLKLDKDRRKTIYARITALQFDESPIETVEGRVTQGSINIDGSSAVRRSCSLTIVSQEYDYSNYLWGLNTKFKLEIGLQNNVDSSMPEVIWFKQGIYLLTSLNTSSSSNNFTMSLSGKDKMCLLNGEVSGSFESSIDFGTIEEKDSEGNIRLKKIPIPEIIRNMIHQYAGEPYHKIIINDLDTLGLELLEYRYDKPMYLYRQAEPYESNSFMNVTLNGERECWKQTEEGFQKTKLKNLEPQDLDLLVDNLAGSSTPAKIRFDEGAEELWYVAKISFGQTAGYRTTDLVYAGDLIAQIGEAITSILDKIKNMLGEFEYFYNVDGFFTFQKKQSFANTFWTPMDDYEDEVQEKEALALASISAYTFSEGELITAFNNNPNLLNLKNDFSIWGNRISSNGIEIPVHMRYAIDQKPIAYKTLFIDDNDEQLKAYNNKYGTTLKGQSSTSYYTANNYEKTEDGILCDWRELIYQMALDYYHYNFLDDFQLRIIEANGELYPIGQTGYEQYYIDMQGFWRQLYNPSPNTEEAVNYYSEGNNLHWNKAVYEFPETLNFWFDFLDVEGELSQFSVKSIGARSKPINDKDVKSIYFRQTPTVIFDADITDNTTMMSGYKYVQVKNLDSMFSISSQGKSAKDKLDELIYKHSYCIESATITTIPIYYLEPNTRISLYDKNTKLDGDYIISRISIPLSYNGTMSITATKAAKNIL